MESTTIMDSTTIAAILAAVSSGFTCFLGIKAKQARLFSPYQKEFMERQIFEFLAPMDQIMIFHTEKDWNEIRFDLIALIEENYALVPPVILSEYSLFTSDKISWEEFIRLETIISSVYNWTRREVGHSYDYLKIRKNFTPINETVEKIKLFFTLLLFLIILLITTFLIFLFISGGNIEAAKWGVILSFGIAGIMVTFILVYQFLK